MVEKTLTGLRVAVGLIVPGAGPTLDLVATLIGLEEARARQLDRLERKVEDVRDRPFRRGMALLREAQAIPAKASENARLAVEQFRDAHASYEREPALSLWAAVAVSTLSYALGDLDGARYWVPIAYTDVATAIQTECATTSNVSIGRLKVPARHVFAGSRALVALSFVPAAVVAYVLFTTLSPAGGILGVILFYGFGWVILGAARVTKSVGSLPGEMASDAVRKRFVAHAAAARDLVDVAETVRGFGSSIGVDQAKLPSYELHVDEAAYALTFDPSSGQ